MASRYSALSSFNSKTSLNIDQANYSNWNVKNILLKQIYSNDKNFYEQEGIEEKAKEILSVGLINHLIVKYAPSPEGAYELIDGERRWRALNLLLEQGYDKFESVTCRVMSPNNEHEEMIMLITANSSRQKSVTTLIKEAQMLKKELQYMRDNGLKLNGYDLDSGRLRDVVASIMNTSKTKIAEYEAVGNNLIEEFKEILDKNSITFSAAYQISKLLQEEQEELLQIYQEQGELTYKYVVEFAKAKKEEREKEQLPGQISIDDIEDGVADDEEQASVHENVPNISVTEERAIISDNVKETEDDADKVMNNNEQDIVDKVDKKQDIVDGIDQNQKNVHEIVGEIETEKKLRCALSLLDKERGYQNLLRNDKYCANNENHIVRNTVTIEAYEYYIKFLKKELGDDLNE